jgi:cyclase
MLKVRVVPVLLLKEGRMIKTKRFRFYKDTGDPLKTVKVYDAQGADELVILDISATVEGRNQWLDLITESAKQCFIPITVGGGIKTVEGARRAFMAGADRITVSTHAVEDPEFINRLADSFGRANVVVCIDAKRDGRGVYKVTTHSATRFTDKSVIPWAIEAAGRGAGEILLHFTDHDGMMTGYDLALLKAVADAVDVPVMALGGVGTLQDLVDGVIRGHASAVAAASIFHFTDQSPIKAHTYMNDKGIPVCLA